MTEQCRAVLSECDLPESDAVAVERVLCHNTPAQVVNLVWKRDPEGVHTFEWFLPFFERGYLKRLVWLDPEPSFDAGFLEAYGLASGWADVMSSYDLPLLEEMSTDIPRMRRAMERSKVKRVSYLRKVYEGERASVAVVRTPVTLDIGNRGVRTKEIG